MACIGTTGFRTALLELVLVVTDSTACAVDSVGVCVESFAASVRAFKDSVLKIPERMVDESLRIASRLRHKCVSTDTQRAAVRCFHRKQPPARFAFYQGAF